MSVGTVVLGLLNGLTIGLLAAGLVLVYKSNRFLNLAHAQLGTLSALLVAKWVLDWGWSWWIAFALSVVVGIGSGLGVERFLVRPLRRRTSSPITLLLLTVGVSQVLLGLTYIPRLGPSAGSEQPYPQPYESHAQVGGVILSGTAVLTLVLVPVLLLGLTVFLRYSSLGKQIRAAASNPDAARLCGISVDRVSWITWGIAGGVSAVSAVLQAPTQASFNVASLGPQLLMMTLGAAAFGAFVSIPAAVGGGVVLGLLSQVVSAETSSASNAQLAAFVAILAVVFLRGRAISQVFASSGGAVPERPVTRVPEVLRDALLVRHHRGWLSATSLAVGLLLPLAPFFASEGNRFLLVLVVVYALVGISLTILLGWAGQVSLGHFALVGLGAFVAVRLGAHGWTLPALLLVAGLVGAFASVLVGLPALRVRGLTLAVTTLGLAVIAPSWLFLRPWVGGDNPFDAALEPPAFAQGLGRPGSQLSIYYTAVAVLALTAAACAALRRSTPGRLVVAVRDNERASAAFGIAPATVKLAILATSGFIAAMAGVLYAVAWQVVSPPHFGAEVSAALLAVPVIGGLGSISGAAAAAALVYLPTFFVAPHLAGLFGSFGQNIGFLLILAGLGQVGTLMQFPTGIAGLAQQGWQRFLDRWAERVTSRLPAEDAPPLMTEGVRVRFGGIVALDSPRIVVMPGEIVGLIGPNGAGKSTLMNVVSGVVRPESGSVQLFGNEVVDLPADLRATFGAARGFQDAALFAGLTVTETIQVALARNRRVGFLSSLVSAPWVRATERETREEALAIVERFGLTPWADALTNGLSTGTRRICDLAAQVATQPRLLLLDEPTAGVAQRDAEAFGPLLRRIRDELDCAILLVEHDMPLLMGLCDRVYAMDAGAVIAEGTPEAIRNDPAVIASYLGTEQTAIGRSGSTPKPRAAPRRRAPASRARGPVATPVPATPVPTRARRST